MASKARAQAEKGASRRDRVNELSTLSESEKKRRLEEMMATAGEVDRQRLNRVDQAKGRDAAELDQPMATTRVGAPLFLDKMQRDTYSRSALKLEERLHQNRHYNQKGSSLDSAGFIRD